MNIQELMDNVTKALEEREARLISKVDKLLRRRVSTLVYSILEKAGYSVLDLFISDKRAKVEDIDRVLNEGQYKVETRMAIKNMLLEDGLMEEGIVAHVDFQSKEIEEMKVKPGQSLVKLLEECEQTGRKM